MNSSLLDYYRCPEELVRLQSAAELSSRQGFFRFHDAAGWGRAAGQVAARFRAAPVYNGLPITHPDDGMVVLPFDLDEVVDNLRLESYAVAASGFLKRISETAAVRQAYYSLRPHLPVNVRRLLQQFHFRDWRNIKFPQWPIDCNVDSLLESAMALAVGATADRSIPFVWFWPRGQDACALVTHDVEHQPGVSFCHELMTIDDSYGIKSSFQIVPESRYVVTERLLSGLKARGFEVNVHDLNHDGHLFECRQVFLERLPKINAYGQRFGASGFRAGAMYRNARWIPELQFSYDMSMPNAGHLEPQRGGCCTIMPFKIGNLIELPLTVTQDYSLFHILKQYSMDLWKAEIDFLAGRNGLITIIAHPDYTAQAREQNLYRKLLEYVAELRGSARLWVPLPREAAEWWRLRSRLTLEYREGDWSIVGEGSENAELAFAELEGDKLVYRVGTRRFAHSGHLECAACQ